MKIRLAKKIMKARLLMKKNSHWFHVINLPYWKMKHNLMLTHKSIDHRITKAISLTSKKKKMAKYEYEYMVTSIVIDKADEIAKVLTGRFNQEGYEGWELVQWNLIPPSALATASTTPCCGSIYILATFKKSK